MKEYRKKYNQTHKKQRKEHYQIHKERIVEWSKKYYQDNKEKIKVQHKKYYQTHKKELNIVRKNYMRNKRKTDISFRIAHNLRSRIWKVLKGNSKSKPTMKLLGCNNEFLNQYFFSKFYDREDGLKMTFKNYGLWHIDHIRPCSSFNLSKPEEQEKCFNYKNLQPLWAEENLNKGCK
jgi:hypothetical protein